MELEASLSWLAMTMTPGMAARLSARLLREFGSPENVFRASLTALESCNLSAPVAQAIFRKQNFWRAEDVIEDLPTPVRAALVQAEAVGSEQRNLLAPDSLTDLQKRIYDLLSVEEPRPLDDIVETSGLNSSQVLATLFDLEIKGMVRQLPGKQFSKVLL